MLHATNTVYADFSIGDSGVSRGGAHAGCSSTPLRLRGIQLISANMHYFTSINNITSILLDKNAILKLLT